MVALLKVPRQSKVSPIFFKTCSDFSACYECSTVWAPARVCVGLNERLRAHQAELGHLK